MNQQDLVHLFVFTVAMIGAITTLLIGFVIIIDWIQTRQFKNACRICEEWKEEKLIDYIGTYTRVDIESVDTGSDNDLCSVYNAGEEEEK